MNEKEIEAFKGAIKRLHGCASSHIRTESVVEAFKDQIIWQGQVEVFSLSGHKKTNRCYAWSFQNENGKTEYVAVLELPPVVDAQTAVQAYLVSLSKNR